MEHSCATGVSGIVATDGFFHYLSPLRLYQSMVGHSGNRGRAYEPFPPAVMIVVGNLFTGWG